MKLSEKQWLFLQDIAKLITYATSLNDVKITAGEMYRTQYQQDRYLLDELSNAKSSAHQDRLAFDLNLFVRGELISEKENPFFQLLGKQWESLDKKNRWGGNFSTILDPGHFERQS